MIYCVEDDRSIRELVVYTLESTGFEAKGFENAEMFFDELKKRIPDLVLLDIMLPGEDGISVLKKLKAAPQTEKMPVIMLTARQSEYDKVMGLDMGADDYIAKPFGMMELISRIKAVLRRSEAVASEQIFKAGNVVLMEKSHQVLVDGQQVLLTLKEFDMLCLMMKSRPAVLTRDMLLEKIWGYDFDGETRTVDVHVRTLRTKLKSGADIIETVRGVGYKVVE